MEIFICSIFNKWTVWYTNNCRRKRRGDFSNNSFTGFTVNICTLREHPFKRTPIPTLVFNLHYTFCHLWRADSYVRIQFRAVCDASSINMTIAHESDTVKVPALFWKCVKYTYTRTHEHTHWNFEEPNVSHGQIIWLRLTGKHIYLSYNERNKGLTIDLHLSSSMTTIHKNHIRLHQTLARG